MSFKPIDDRQLEHRTILQELFPWVGGQTLDVLMSSIDSDLTPPLKVDATAVPGLVLNIGPAIVPNSQSNRNKSISFISNVLPSFTGGTATFPSASGGNIVMSTGGTFPLVVPSNNFIKVLLYLDQSGNLNASSGTPNPVSSSATVPDSSSSTLPFAYVTLFNNAGTIQNITQNNIFQMSSGGGSGGGSLTTQSINSNTNVNNGICYLVDTTSSAITLNLPSPADNFSFAVKDRTGNAPINNITIHRFGSELIDGNSNDLVLANSLEAVTLISDGINWFILDEYSSKFIQATGGTITFSGNKKIHTFTTSGNFQVIANSGTIQYLLVASGGGGGNGTGGAAGGGGAGGYLPGSTSINIGTYPVVIGAGGAGGATSASNGTDGQNSTFDALTAIAGGGGSGALATPGDNGGSGGGGRFNSIAGGSGTVGQGNAGGNGNGTNVNGCGGGGAGSVGLNSGTIDGGSGGSGLSSSISGSSVTYAGGGGGTASGAGAAGPGGSGGGGTGATSGNNGGNAGANTGGGGGGGTGTNGGNGSSGIVIISYQYQ